MRWLLPFQLLTAVVTEAPQKLTFKILPFFLTLLVFTYTSFSPGYCMSQVSAGLCHGFPIDMRRLLQIHLSRLASEIDIVYVQL